MLKRYIGNKSALVPNILQAVGKYASRGDRIGDLFAGTMCVSLALKASGYRVVANDINLFSSVFGKAFIENSEIPEIEVSALVPMRFRKKAESLSKSQLESLRGQSGFAFLAIKHHADRYFRLLVILNYLFQTKPQSANPNSYASYIFNTYCEKGLNSRFVSARGRKGRRRFFSPENAKRIDTILNQLRNWRRSADIADTVYYILCSVLVRAVEKVSNTQGTYHDFPRERYDSRALRPIAFEAPPFDDTLVGGQHIVGNALDSLEFAKKIPQLDVLYLDPPYNFRQYTAYYFLPNMLCQYSDLDDLESYFRSVQYVRGQNMASDFTSSFCKNATFISSLSTLIERAQSRVVILSYFSGRNHWNEFKSISNGTGFNNLEDLFGGPLFASNLSTVIPIKRLNYQSYGGYKAKEIDEYLFVGTRRPERRLRAA
jgi:adenine-specific DNA methylase